MLCLRINPQTQVSNAGVDVETVHEDKLLGLSVDDKTYRRTDDGWCGSLVSVFLQNCSDVWGNQTIVKTVKRKQKSQQFP